MRQYGMGGVETDPEDRANHCKALFVMVWAKRWGAQSESQALLQSFLSSSLPYHTSNHFLLPTSVDVLLHPSKCTNVNNCKAVIEGFSQHHTRHAPNAGLTDRKEAANSTECWRLMSKMPTLLCWEETNYCSWEDRGGRDGHLHYTAVM